MRTLGMAFATGLLISHSMVWGQLMVTPNPLTFNVPIGASTVSAVANITFNGVPVTVNSVSATTTTGQNWLQPAIPGSMGIVTVTVNPSGLSASSYSGTVVAITSNGAVSFQINLTVGGGAPPGTPAPSSLILVLTGLAGVGLYQVKRVFARARRSSPG